MHPNSLETTRNRDHSADRLGALQQIESMPYLGAAVPVGLVGAAVVAVLIFVLDTLAGHPLGTPSALGAVLFRGETFSLQAPIHPGLVLAYTLIHTATFVAVAAAAVSAEYTLSRQGVSAPIQLVSGIMGIFVGLQTVFVALTTVLEISWIGQLGFERIVVANMIAAFSMALAVYLRAVSRRSALVPVPVR
jgi:hypothetical protein